MYKINEVGSAFVSAGYKTVFAVSSLMLIIASLAGVPLAQATDAQWQGSYWAVDEEDIVYEGPEWPSGAADFTGATGTIDYDWNDGEAPDDSLGDYYVARWTKTITVSSSTPYFFEAEVDGGLRFFIDDEQIFDSWGRYGTDDFSHFETLAAGSYDLTVEYVRDEENGEIEFRYEPLTAAVDVLGQPNFTTFMEDSRNANATGFDDPEGLAIDTVNHRLFVADNDGYAANRILVFNLNSNNELVDETADFVIGQSSTVGNGSICGEGDTPTLATNLCEPKGLEVDNTNQRLFVADSGHSRVLVYDITTGNLANGMTPDYVIGQPNFTLDSCRWDNDDSSEASLCWPVDVAYDHDNDRLFVSDSDDSRVLAYDVTPADMENGLVADNVIGQEDFDDNWCNHDEDVAADTLCYPMGIDYDESTDKLLVADSENDRVLVYDDTITNGMDAEGVIGQYGFDVRGCYNTETDAEGLCEPMDVLYGSVNGLIIVGDDEGNRILLYDVDPPNVGDNGIAADNIIGQEDFESGSCNQDDEDNTAADYICYTQGFAYAPTANSLYVADTDNSRVLSYDLSALADGMNAENVVGQSTFTTAYAFGIVTPNNRGFSQTEDIALDTVDNRAFIADLYNDRVLVFDLDADGRPVDDVADVVIGQPDMSSQDCEADAEIMCEPKSVAYDSANKLLFVSDNNSRVLVFDADPAELEDGAAAINVLGQEDFEDDSCNQADAAAANTLCYASQVDYVDETEQLFVADAGNNRVVQYDLSSGITDNMDAVHVLGQADFESTDCNRGDSVAANTLCSPYGAAYDTVNDVLYVGDYNNSRVIGYEGPLTDGQDADYVIGQTDMTSGSCNASDYDDDDLLDPTIDLCYPEHITADPAQRRLYVADTSNDRLTMYRYNNIMNSEPAISYDGIYNTMEDCNANGGQYTLCGPSSAEVNADNGEIWIADSYFNRAVVLGANTFTTTDADGDGLDDSVEDGGPNSGDANGDGIKDSEQANVSSFVNAVTGTYAALEIDEDCSVSEVTITPETVNSASDSGFSYPFGLMNFTVDCGTSGFTANVKQFYYGTASTTVVRKYNPNTSAYFTITGATTQQTTIGGQSVVRAAYQVVDGAVLDLDGAANGIIVDPAGPGVSAVGSPNTGFREQ